MQLIVYSCRTLRLVANGNIVSSLLTGCYDLDHPHPIQSLKHLRSKIFPILFPGTIVCVVFVDFQIYSHTSDRPGTRVEDIDRQYTTK